MVTPPWGGSRLRGRSPGQTPGPPEPRHLRLPSGPEDIVLCEAEGTSNSNSVLGWRDI